ncbi:hypothetical protein EJ06DRAFT_579771 [Trichodelitschia bisporula]|uniref:Calponin-homology (CH) domain-containing protein n=1 Tax=Trichodelitschia bisporula TaxID=703511 RepID=A0A6G1I781_9PEZI|nr:hypothetical protein EJ06DRAFT_579771 [Trichodelitschia bisporula]
MASVTSLDQDMKALRLSRYTPKAANEVRAWIEDALGENLPQKDLLELLKDGTILCRLVNNVLPPPGVRFKNSKMPFMQMENISHFLAACERPPLNLPAHDRFLTVDLYEQKDPAQVLQCISAFSRVAYSLNPSRFPEPIGPKRGGAMSPSVTGSMSSSAFARNRKLSSASSVPSVNSFAPPPVARTMSPMRTGGSTGSESRMSPAPISSWSKKSDEGVTAPAWNIAQYGYMGGASQGNQGIAFGGRRQITSPGPNVPSFAEKERKRKLEAERQRAEVEALEQQLRLNEERAQREEEQRWEEEARRAREEEKQRVEQQKREWEEQEQQWKAEEEARQREDKDLQGRLQSRKRTDVELKGQFLSQYKQDRSRQSSFNDPVRQAERERVRDLERQLEEAKERERLYLQEREGRPSRDEGKADRKARSRSRSKAPPPPREPSPQESNVSWVGNEQEYLRQQWAEQQARKAARTASPQRPLPNPADAAPSLPSRPLPDPTTPKAATASPARPLPTPSSNTSTTPRPLPTPTTSSSSVPRPLPDPLAYARKTPTSAGPPSRVDTFLSQNPAPAPRTPTQHYPAELGLTSSAEQRSEDARRAQSQVKTKAGGWASKSLLEKEMERERERQREWEEAQRAQLAAERDESQGAQPGKSWDVNQYGYLGGDSQNRGDKGIGFGGRRQIIGPRPRP